MRGFTWILDGRLAGSPRPGLLDSYDEDLAWLKARGIHLIVSLTRNPLSPSPLGFQCLHFPIDDMGVPTPRAAAALCQAIIEILDQGHPVVLHCKAGLGRTGTLLACCLVTLGRSGEEALSEVRRYNPSFVQNQLQEMFILHYESFLAGEPAADARSSAALAVGLPPLRLPFRGE